jgi:hypothetical protein
MKPFWNIQKCKKELPWRNKSELQSGLIRESGMEVLKEFEALEDDYESI